MEMIKDDPQSLESRCCGKINILDTSFVLPSGGLAMKEHGAYSLVPISEDTLKDKMQRLDSIESVIKTQKIIVLNEAYHEMRAGVFSVKKQNDFYQRFFRPYKSIKAYTPELADGFSEYISKAESLVSKLRDQRFRIRFTGTAEKSYLEMRQLLEREKERLIERAHPSSKEYIKKKFEEKARHFNIGESDYRGEYEVPFKEYMTFLQIAFLSSRDFQADSLAKSSKMNGSGLGYILSTDRKIVATAFALSYKHKVNILTMDKGIRTLVGRVRAYNRNKAAWSYFHIDRFPDNYLGVFDPSGYVKLDENRQSPSYKRKH